ncbi:MATE family efflux transporter [Thalassobium sp. R2A62]|jgi:multidrug resistance protein, MATE family|uniref:MATE family efflux transporter n=1 Tax=Thalassobium sp. R2A62 TaxID=633131 RepID=UPI0001B1D043|nr:MATE family efflux transporter [Thalassobium sp. R2A62]EET47100.1 mate efflux family protein [Thalassobium sp. R2A62]MDG1338830.1 MATE family efflux transporter [Paracoccaceae bacterium]MDG2451898.1 MATE family efflux transporter [Paracoccaceae bacterium]
MNTQTPVATTRSEHARALMVLGMPLIGSHVAQFLIHITDTIMLGWYDVTALAAVTLAGSYYFVVFIVGAGFAWAVLPMVARAAEDDDEVRIRRVTRMGVWLSMLYAAILLPTQIWSEPIFLAIGQDPEVSALAQDYLRIAAWALFPGLLIMVLKAYLSALEHTKFQLWIVLIAAVVNIPINYLLIFGNFGAPELGIQGAAIASVAVTLVSVLGLVAYSLWVFPHHDLFRRMWRVDRGALREVFRLGWPIGLTSLAESGLFSMSAVMMGWIGALELAAHGIALQLISMIFMIHVGLSSAATVRAGRALGRRDDVGLRVGGQVAIAISLFVAVVTAVIFLTTPEPLIAIFLSPDDPQRGTIIGIAVSLLAVAALFQLVDAAQIMALGLLRGLQDTTVPMVYAGISYWIVGVPTSYVLGFTLGWGGVGIWAGLAIGLFIAAVLLMTRFRNKSTSDSLASTD